MAGKPTILLAAASCMYISVGRRMPQSPIVAVMEYPNDGDFPA